MRDGQKNQNDANDIQLKEVVSDLDGTDRSIILRAKNTGA